MDTYSLLRQIADSWVLLSMFAFFVGAIIWAFRPGSSATYKSVSEIPFRNETAATKPKTCNGTCDSCSATKVIHSLNEGTDV